MKNGTLILGLLVATLALAHEGGHGPRVSDSPKQGGVVAPVIKASEATLHGAAKLVYKGELVRSEDGTVRVYVYDQAMNPIALAGFEKSAKAILESKKNKKWEKRPFELIQASDAFVGKMPPVTSKPFNIDVTLKEGSKSLFVAFDHLD